MPNPSRTPTISPNNAVLNSLTHTEQFQEFFIRVKEWLVAAGGTVLISNGGGVAGSGDNIGTTRSNVTLGTSGSGAWVVVEFASTTIANSTHRVLFYVNDSSDPRQFAEWRQGPGSWSGGSTSALPTLSGVATIAHSFTLHPLTTSQNMRWSSWRTTSPNRPQRFMIKQEGSIGVLMILDFVSNTDSDGGGAGNERWATMINGTTSDSNSAAVSGNPTFWNALNASGSTDVSTEGNASIWDAGSAWTSGLDGFGNAHPQPVLVGQTPADGRILGIWVDTFAIPQNFGFGIRIDDSETGQTYQRYGFGDFSYYWPAGVTIE